MKSTATILSILFLLFNANHSSANPLEITSEIASEKRGAKLSHINDLPVKVGEHSDYYYDYKKFNISTNPVGLLLGFVGISASVALSSHIALRGETGRKIKFARLDTIKKGPD